jgi:hypothetical protein
MAKRELERRGYSVSLNGTPGIDLLVGKPMEFAVVVSSLWDSGTTWWMMKKEQFEHLFYVLVVVGKADDEGRFFVLSQQELNDLIDRYQEEHPRQKPLGGFAWQYPHRFEDRWDALPGAPAAAGKISPSGRHPPPQIDRSQ